MPDRLVTAVMITGKSPERAPFAKAALQSFAAQTYPNKELVVINSGTESVLEAALAMGLRSPVVEVWVQDADQSGKTLGDLRNMALEAGSGWYYIQWDDDDWSHPERMEAQVKLCRAIEQETALGVPLPAAVTYMNQIRYNFKTGHCYVHRQSPRPGYAVGIPGTIVHTYVGDCCYPSLSKSEDTKFAQRFSKRFHIWDNDPKMYLRFYHGANTWDETHIMGPKKFHSRQPKLNSECMAYLEEILEKHYAFANPAKPVAFQQ